MRLPLGVALAALALQASMATVAAGPDGDPYGSTSVTAVDNVTLSSVTVHWEGFCGSSSYAGTPSFHARGSTAPANTSAVVQGRGPYWTNLTGLQPRTEYDFWLAGHCGIMYTAGSTCFRTDPAKPECVSRQGDATATVTSSTTDGTTHSDPCTAFNSTSQCAQMEGTTQSCSQGATCPAPAPALPLVALVALVLVLAAARRRLP